jgi:hypothetical protein
MKKEERINLFQMYIKNDCRMGFYVTRDTWRSDRYAKVTAIECVIYGNMIEGEPPYFGNLNYPPGHPREGELMWMISMVLNFSLDLFIRTFIKNGLKIYYEKVCKCLISTKLIA